MKKFILLISIYSSPFVNQIGFAQIEGLWTVEKVTVGKQILTPVAKWTQINKDGTFQSGNGWVQNSEGTWQYENNELFIQETNEIEEGFGAFKVQVLSSQKMIWQRLEEGNLVIVEWGKITKKPMAPADQLVGLWDLIKFEKEGKDVTQEVDPENKYYVFMRWDRVYVERTTKGQKEMGYWYINAHHPEFVLINQKPEKTTQNWFLIFENDKMIWKGNSTDNQNQTLIFVRLKQFPK